MTIDETVKECCEVISLWRAGYNSITITTMVSIEYKNIELIIDEVIECNNGVDY